MGDGQPSPITRKEPYMIIKRICEKYPIDYTLMPDIRMSAVHLCFGSDLSKSIQDRLMEKLDQLGVLRDGMGISMEFSQVDHDREKYVLRVCGKDMFYYTPHFEALPFLQCDMAEAVAWSIYVLASHTDWLDGYQGRFLYCQCFSSRQQAAALRIFSSVTRQYQNTVSQAQIQQVFNNLKCSVSKLVNMAPRFSGQPIEADVFSRTNNRSLDGSLQEIAQTLFGNRDFEEELRAYNQLVQNSPGYHKVLADAVDTLTQAAYELPIMAVSGLFAGLGTLIDEITPTKPSKIQKLLQNPVKLTLSPQGLKSTFSELDAAYLEQLHFHIETEFLRTACGNAYNRIKKEYTDARRNIMQLYSALGHFCFVRQGSFPLEDMPMLSWRQLSHLEERDIYSKDVNWDANSLNDLQSVMKSNIAPYLWISSKALANLGKRESITDALTTYPVPVMDEKLVWAIWVENH